MNTIKKIWLRFTSLNWEEPVWVAGTGILCLGLVVVLWVLGVFSPSRRVSGAASTEASLTPVAVQTSTQKVLADILASGELAKPTGSWGISRLANLRTTLQDPSSFKVTRYTVVAGDTLYDIANKFNLKPASIMWANQSVLGDDPDQLLINQVLNILPVDGVYHRWHQGDSLTAVARYYGVSPEDIISYPGNSLSEDTIGDLSNPNIPDGAWLVVPGGHREYVSRSGSITRFNPSAAKIFGPGACSKPTDGPVGGQVFVWPTTEKWLSGYDYEPGINHLGIDIAGQLGNSIYAADNGVVVYAGWNDWGYGNTTVIDHGDGWQTLYAHQSAILVGCGQGVARGQQIGSVGSTGRSSGTHLHFEMMLNGTKVNPHQYLPAP